MQRVKLHSSIASESYKLVDGEKLYFLKTLKVSIIRNLDSSERSRIRKRLLGIISPYLVKVENISFNGDIITITTEFIKGVPLNNVIELKKYGKIMSNEYKYSLVRSLAAGLKALHEAGLIHGDFKTSNIIIENGSLIPKITDFCFNYVKFRSRRIPFFSKFIKRYRYALFSSRNYMPPESFFNQNLGKHIDYYALGISSFRIMTGRYPVPFRLLNSEEELIKWKISPEHDRYYLSNLEKANIPMDTLNLILNLIINYKDEIDLDQIEKEFGL